MLDCSWLMLQPQLSSQLAPKVHLLIVAEIISDVSPIAEVLTADGINFTYDVATPQVASQSSLHRKSYHAVLYYRTARERVASLLNLLAILEHFQPAIPLILITKALGEEVAVQLMKVGIEDYVLQEKLFCLPQILRRSLAKAATKQQEKVDSAYLDKQIQQQVIIKRIMEKMRDNQVLDEILQTTVNLLAESFPVNGCLLFRFVSPDKVRICYVSQAANQRENICEKIYLINPAYNSELISRKPLVFNIIDESTPEVLKAMSQDVPMRSLLLMPLQYQQLKIGGIILYCNDRNYEWKEDILEVVNGVAIQCVIAIYQREIAGKLAEENRREKLISKISKVVNSQLEPREILQQIGQQVGRSFEVDRVIIFLEKNGEFQFCQEWRKNQQIPSLLGKKISPSHCPELFDANSQFRLGKVFQASNRTACTELSFRSSLSTLEAEQQQNMAFVWIPILLRDRFIGGFILELDSREKQFSQEEIATIETIANQTAIAIDYAQNYYHLEEQIKQRNQAMEEANRSRSVFLSQMSHELRTPLTGILGFSRVLMDQLYGPLNDKQMQYMNALHSCGDHLLSLINDLLDLSKIEAKREELFLERVPVEEICLASMSVVQEKAREGNLELSLEIAPEIGICIADQRRLKQILVNLLSNAIKFTEAGSVILKVSQQEKMLLFSVVDTGIGINQADLKTLFQPYRQIKTHLHRKHKGTGLGLALSRELARLHGGDLTATSEPGKGSCFTLYLPKRNWENVRD
ncbi:MAG: ATP-binding protein [Oscillatoria sp. PMC 1051.18]|nr:ATP-binding protein [Oscillatoria sp. PMC 1050.18]MEC5028534.1 ATP-binding protein [Oscillatoria sp. PMC 1051.18]